jgi:hypothetical protein
VWGQGRQLTDTNMSREFYATAAHTEGWYPAFHRRPLCDSVRHPPPSLSQRTDSDELRTCELREVEGREFEELEFYL